MQTLKPFSSTYWLFWHIFFLSNPCIKKKQQQAETSKQQQKVKYSQWGDKRAKGAAANARQAAEIRVTVREHINLVTDSGC